MNWIGRHRFFFACLAMGAVAVGLEGVLGGQAVIRTQRALKVLAQKRQERDAMARVSPAPSEANQRSIASELHAVDETLAKLRSGLIGIDATKTNGVLPPSTPLDAYFAISRFVEETRSLAFEKHVTFKPDECFGMASYLSEGPDTALVPVVNQQRLVLQEIIGALLAAKPRELLAVRRQRPGSEGNAAADTGAVADYFAPPRLTGALPNELIRTQAFQVEFSGHTAALREFLNSLAGSRLPLLVRSLEVEPVESAGLRERSGTSAAGPVVTPGYSKFSVTVDFVELLPTAMTSP